MDLIVRWMRRLAVLSVAATAAVLVPAVAWAAENPTALAVADELAKKRRSGGGGVFGLLGLCCCVAVVGAIVLAVVLVRRRKAPPHQ